jgi:hypothetical protein
MRLHQDNWLDRTLNSFALKLDDLAALMRTRYFWSVAAVCFTVGSFFVASFIILTNFNVMRMRNCFHASNMSTYLMFNTLLFFVFGGLLAMGEVFNYFDNKKRGVPHKRNAIFWFITITSTLGTLELIMLKISC